MISSLSKKRCYIIFVILLLVFTTLIIRIVNYKYFKSEDLALMAENQYQYKEKTSELNYLLLDNKGRDLLNYLDIYYVVIDPYTYSINNHYAKKDDLEALKIILKGYNSKYDIDKEIIENKSSKIKWVIDEEVYNKLKKIKGVNGFYVYKYSTIDRENAWWNVENLITNVYKNGEEKLQKKSDNSIEMKIAEKTKNNQYVYNVFSKDVNGDITNEFNTSPKDNVNVRLTLDKNLQSSIKEVLNRSQYSQYDQIGVVLMEADSGKIRAMVQKDDSKPNVNIGASTNKGFFAGSIFKAIVEEAGIETGTISLNHLYKHKNYGGLFEEHEDKKSKNAKEAFIKSSNNIFVQIGEDVGIKNVNSVAEKHGLYKKVLDFDDEESGNLELDIKQVKDNSGDSLQAYIGQKSRVTPIEAISIPNTVANRGIYVKPYIIDAYVDNNNNVIEKLDTEKKRILNESTANILKSQMIQVVSTKEGTGKTAYIDGVEIGGKTGTSTRMEDVIDKDSKAKKTLEYYDGWFTGFFKIENKYYSMVVFAQNIGKETNASGIAAPVFKEIVEEVDDYLNKF